MVIFYYHYLEDLCKHPARTYRINYEPMINKLWQWYSVDVGRIVGKGEW